MFHHHHLFVVSLFSHLLGNVGALCPVGEARLEFTLDRAWTNAWSCQIPDGNLDIQVRLGVGEYTETTRRDYGNDNGCGILCSKGCGIARLNFNDAFDFGCHPVNETFTNVMISIWNLRDVTKNEHLHEGLIAIPHAPLTSSGEHGGSDGTTSVGASESAWVAYTYSWTDVAVTTTSVAGTTTSTTSTTTTTTTTTTTSASSTAVSSTRITSTTPAITATTTITYAIFTSAIFTSAINTVARTNPRPTKALAIPAQLPTATDSQMNQTAVSVVENDAAGSSRSTVSSGLIVLGVALILVLIALVSIYSYNAIAGASVRLPTTVNDNVVVNQAYNHADADADAGADGGTAGACLSSTLAAYAEPSAKQSQLYDAAKIAAGYVVDVAALETERRATIIAHTTPHGAVYAIPLEESGDTEYSNA